MAAVTIDTNSVIHTVKFGLLWKPEKMYDRYVTNKDECSYEDFLIKWNTIIE